MPDPAPTPARDTEPDQFLDGDMTPADIVEILEGLSFQRTRGWQREHPRLLSIDVEVRNFLVRALRRSS